MNLSIIDKRGVTFAKLDSIPQLSWDFLNMTLFFVWCLVAVLANSNHADSLMMSRNRLLSQHCVENQASSQRHHHLQAVPESLVEISDGVLETIRKRRTISTGNSGLTSRPGFTFGLGCDKWEASSYSGGIEGWDSEPMIRWVSRSFLREMPYEQKTMGSEVDTMSQSGISTTPAIQTRLDMHFSAGPMVDIPSMRMTVSESAKGYSVLLDFVPRVELLTSMDYFDKYFKNLEESMSVLIAEGISRGILRRNIPESVLSKILQGPFSLSADIDIKSGGYVRELCLHYANRWCTWLDAETALAEREQSTQAEVSHGIPGSSLEAEGVEKKLKAVQEQKQSALISMYNRDQCVQKLFFEEQKYELAKVMGSDFAPKAAELAAAIIGPSIGASSYILY